MTGKRFKLGDYSNNLQEIWFDEDYIIVRQDDAERLCELLNNFNNENKQLTIEKDTIQKQHSYELTKKLEYKSKLIDTQKQNHELKQLLKQQSEGFQCTIEENYTEFNKDKIYIKDNNTQINLKNGKIDIIIYIPQINDIKRFSYFITGKTITERYLEDLKEHNKKIIDKELKK